MPAKSSVSPVVQDLCRGLYRDFAFTPFPPFLMVARRNFYWTGPSLAIYCEKQFALEQETCSYISCHSPKAHRPKRPRHRICSNRPSSNEI